MSTKPVTPEDIRKTHRKLLAVGMSIPLVTRDAAGNLEVDLEMKDLLKMVTPNPHDYVHDILPSTLGGSPTDLSDSRTTGL
jgi:hypothetical protein